MHGKTNSSKIRQASDNPAIGYGNTGALMYAMQKDGTWQTISPTNQFNGLSLPSCEMVNQHGISKDIAPVCWTTEQSHERAPRHYTYSLR